MADWGAALQALGQSLMQFPEFQQRRQQYQREKDLWANEDAVNKMRLAREQQAMELAQQQNTRDQQRFEWDQSDKLADSSRIGSELFLDSPLWQAIAKGPGQTSFEDIRANAVAADPLKDALPALASARAVHGVGGMQGEQLTEAPLGPVAGKRRVPNFSESQLIQQTRNMNTNAYQQGLLEQGGERLAQGSRRLDIQERQGNSRLQMQQLALNLAHKRLADANARQDLRAAQQAATDVARLTAELTNIVGRSANATADRFTGERDPAAVSELGSALGALREAIGRIPQGATPTGPAPAGPPTTPTVAPEPRIMSAPIERVRELARIYRDTIRQDPTRRDTASELAFRERNEELKRHEAELKQKEAELKNAPK